MGQHATIHVRASTSFNGADGVWVPAKGNAAGQLEIAPIAGEYPQFNRTAAGTLVKYRSITASENSVNTPCIFYGIKVISAGTSVTVYDNNAASGTLIMSAEATTAAGAILTPAGAGAGILLTTGLYVSMTGGTLLVLYADAV